VSAAQESGVLMDRLSNRVLGALYRNGVSTLEDLCACPEKHVQSGVGVGKKTMSEIRPFLESVGCGFAPERDWKGCGCAVCRAHEERRRARPRLDLSDLWPGLVRELAGGNVLPFRPRGAA
jgi:hypothetical protein